MIGMAPVPPRAPMLVTVNVPPRRSSSVALPSRTRWARVPSSRWTSSSGFLSTSRITRTISPRSAATRVEGGVEDRVLAEGLGDGLEDEAGQGERHPASLAGLEVAPDEGVEVG